MHKCVKKEVKLCLGPKEFVLDFKSLLSPPHPCPPSCALNFFFLFVTKNLIFKISFKARSQVGWVGGGENVTVCVCV